MPLPESRILRHDEDPKLVVKNFFTLRGVRWARSFERFRAIARGC